MIFDRVWGYDFGYGSNSLDVYISYLRKKTEAGGRAAPDPHGARRRLRAARAVSLRARLALGSAAAVAVTIVLASVVVYFLVRTSFARRSTRTCRTEAAQIANGARLRDLSRLRAEHLRARSCPRRSSAATSSSSTAHGNIYIPSGYVSPKPRLPVDDPRPAASPTASRHAVLLRHARSRARTRASSRCRRPTRPRPGRDPGRRRSSPASTTSSRGSGSGCSCVALGGIGIAAAAGLPRRARHAPARCAT